MSEHDQQPDPARDEQAETGATEPTPTSGQPGSSGPADDVTQPEPAASTQSGVVPGAGGRRVTRRTVHRREVTENTEETITEDIPLEAYQGPTSTHPAPVG